MNEIPSCAHDGVVIERGCDRACSGTAVDLCVFAGGKTSILDSARIRHEFVGHTFVPLHHLRVRSRGQSFSWQRIGEGSAISWVYNVQALDGILQKRDMLVRFEQKLYGF